MIYSIRFCIIFSFFLLSCSTTKVVYTLGKPYLLENKNLLITIQGLGEFHAVEYFDMLAEKLTDNFNNIQYLYSVEYELKQQGFTKVDIDSIGQSIEISTRAADVLGANYFLQIEALNLYESDMIDTDPNAINSNVTLYFKIVDLRNLTVSSGFQVSVSTVGLEDRNETNWELSSLSLIVPKCIKKGAKAIKKGIISNK